MKKVMMTLSAFALVAMFAACGGAKSDAEAIAKKKCECEKIEDEAKKKECTDALKQMSDDFDKKYTDTADADYKEAVKFMEEYKCEDKK